MCKSSGPNKTGIKREPVVDIAESEITNVYRDYLALVTPESCSGQGCSW